MEQQARIVSIDAFRGFAVLGMVLANHLILLSWIKAQDKL